MTILVSTLIQSKAKSVVTLAASVAGKVSVCACVAELPSDDDGGPWSLQTLYHTGAPAHTPTLDGQPVKNWVFYDVHVHRAKKFGKSKCCFVKAALPWILELLTTQFKYTRGSVNDGYVQSLRALILNMYSQKCVPQINEEVEDKPESFEMLYKSAPSEALQRALEVLTLYWELVTINEAPIDWTCQNEYTETLSSTTELPSESSTQYYTDSYGRDSIKASQRRAVRDMYKLVFIITSICGGLLFIVTLCCLITHKKSQIHHRLRTHTDLRDLQGIEMEEQ